MAVVFVVVYDFRTMFTVHMRLFVRVLLWVFAKCIDAVLAAHVVLRAFMFDNQPFCFGFFLVYRYTHNQAHGKLLGFSCCRCVIMLVFMVVIVFHRLISTGAFSQRDEVCKTGSNFFIAWFILLYEDDNIAK